MILAIGEAEDRPDEEKWHNPNQPADLVSLPGDKADYPQEEDKEEQNQHKAV
jgi:hypothetical protein